MTLEPRAVADGFVEKGVPRVLVEELMEGFAESKRRFYLGDYRPNAVEGARFAEAAFRILQWATHPNGEFRPVGTTLPRVDKMLEILLASSAHDSIRKHIPRALQMIYTVRNERDVAHLGDGIDPNLQDASVVVHLMGWTLAEFVRLYHSVSADEAQRIIDELVAREVPIIQTVRGFPASCEGCGRANTAWCSSTPRVQRGHRSRTCVTGCVPKCEATSSGPSTP